MNSLSNSWIISFCAAPFWSRAKGCLSSLWYSIQNEALASAHKLILWENQVPISLLLLTLWSLTFIHQLDTLTIRVCKLFTHHNIKILCSSSGYHYGSDTSCNSPQGVCMRVSVSVETAKTDAIWSESFFFSPYLPFQPHFVLYTAKQSFRSGYPANVIADLPICYHSFWTMLSVASQILQWAI